MKRNKIVKRNRTETNIKKKKLWPMILVKIINDKEYKNKINI